MKKHNVIVILALIAANIATGYIIGVALGRLFKVPGFNWFPLITIPFMLMCFIDLTNLIMFPIAKMTMERNLKKNNFGKTTSFINKDYWTLKSMLYIDEDTGRVAYVSVTNPFKFQMVHASELSEIKSTFVEGPFGGTRYVYFEFYYGNTRFRFPTFRTGSTWFLSATKVQKAIATGDKICNLLLKYK